MCSSSRTSFSFNHVEFVVAIVGFLVLSPGGMPDTQTVRGGDTPGTRSKARKPLWRKEPPVGPLKQSHTTFNSWAFKETTENLALTFIQEWTNGIV